jgi:hypothetical protein
MMWVRDLKSPPQALALFQVYHRFAPLTDFSGPIWRCQVDHDVSLQAFLMPGQSHGSFLHLRRGPTLNLRPPLLRIEGQLESLFPAELPLQEWLAQGTRWWLRNLGSPDLDNPMRLGLLHGLAEMDRAAFPELDEAVAYHPVVPLCDGSWLSLEELRKYARVYSAQAGGMTAQPGWHEGYPIVQSLVARSLTRLLSLELEVLENERPEAEERWAFPLRLPRGRAELTLAKDEDGWSSWILGPPRQPNYLIRKIFETPTPAFKIESDYATGAHENSVPPKLLKWVRSAILKQGRELLTSLVRARGAWPQALDLAEVLLRNGVLSAEELEDYKLADQTSLADLRARRHKRAAASQNVVIEKPPEPEPESEPDQTYEPSQLRQLNWTQKAGQHRMQARFLGARDGISVVTVIYQGEELERQRLSLFPDWPLSLDIRLFLTNRPRHPDPEGWLELIAQTLLDGLETPLRLLQTYPEAFHEVCCLTGIALQCGRTPPGWVWDCLDEEGKSLGQQLGGSDPLKTIRQLLDK